MLADANAAPGTAPSAHERHRLLLDALADGESVRAAVEAAVPGRRWQQTFGRFEPDGRHGLATIVLETVDEPQAIVRVQAHEGEDGPRLVVSTSSEDPGLPTLATVIDGAPGTTIVRYRPYKRCTLRCEIDGVRRWGKVLPEGRAEAIHLDATVLWKASQAGVLGFAVAEPDRYDASTGAVWLGDVRGRPVLDDLLSADGPALAGRLGAALGTLAVSGLEPANARRHAPRERAARAARDLSARVPALAGEVARVMAGIDRLHSAAEERPPRPIHGSPHPQQWLLDGDRIGLVDFDRLTLGDPELEVAVFQAEMDFERTAVARDAVNEAFRHGYESIAGALEPRRLAAYRAEQRLVKARRSAWALRPDGDRRAARHLARAAALVEDGDDA